MSCDTEQITTEIKRGSTFEQTIELLDENGDSFNLSNWSVKSDLKKSPGSELLLSFTTDLTQVSNGIIGISASPEQTLSLPAASLLQYDIKLSEPVGIEGDCGIWEELEIWDDPEVWYNGLPWEDLENWDEEDLWLCESYQGNVYYTETLFLQTSKHITD